MEVKLRGEEAQDRGGGRCRKENYMDSVKARTEGEACKRHAQHSAMVRNFPCGGDRGMGR